MTDRDWRRNDELRRLARRDVLRTAGTASLALAGAAGSAAATSATSATTSAGQADRFDPGERIWSVETGGPVESNPTVVDETVYVGSSDGNLYALEAETGAELWRFETGDPPAPPGGEGGSKYVPGVKSSPLVVGDAVYVGANDFTLYALDRQTGDELWTVEAERFVWGSPTYADGVVYVPSRDHRLYAVDAEDGEVLWRSRLENPSGANPAVEDGRVHVGSYGEVNFHTFDAATGELLWKKPYDAEHCSTPAVRDGTVFAIFPDRPLYAFDAETGDVEWEYAGGPETDAAFGIKEHPTVWDGTVYVTSAYNGPGLHAVDAETGEQA